MPDNGSQDGDSTESEIKRRTLLGAVPAVGLANVLGWTKHSNKIENTNSEEPEEESESSAPFASEDHDHSGDVLGEEEAVSSVNVDEVDADEIEVGEGVVDSNWDFPLEIQTNDISRAINIQMQDDDGGYGSFGNIYWTSAAGERIGTIVGSSSDNDIAIYTRQTPLGEGDQEWQNRNRLNIGAGSETVRTGFFSTDILDVQGYHPAFRLMPTLSDEDASTYIGFQDNSYNDEYRIHRNADDNTLRIMRPGVGYNAVFQADLSTDFRGNQVYGLREIESPSQSDLKRQEWAWDATDDRWLYKSSNGTVHHFSPDGTL